ncbi:hypothetical protein TNCV_3554741 [Trichonephila clavipes]|nr:hypothetical protein TNCV_3554741 [Trichonephila clavipes]
MHYYIIRKRGHGTTPLRVKEDSGDISSELGNGGSRLHFLYETLELYGSRLELVSNVIESWVPVLVSLKTYPVERLMHVKSVKAQSPPVGVEVRKSEGRGRTDPRVSAACVQRPNVPPL